MFCGALAAAAAVFCPYAGADTGQQKNAGPDAYSAGPRKRSCMEMTER